MNEYNYFNIIRLTLFKVLNTYPMKYRDFNVLNRDENVLNGINNFNINIKHIRHVKKINIIKLK